MFAHTEIKQAPQWVVPADDKRRARLNCISHLLQQIPYDDVTRPSIDLPPRPARRNEYVRSPIEDQSIVPQDYWNIAPAAYWSPAT